MNVFMRQLQFCGGVGFIAVLINSASYPNCMVHMRNRKLKRTLEEQMAERRILTRYVNFTAVYYVEFQIPVP